VREPAEASTVIGPGLVMVQLISGYHPGHGLAFVYSASLQVGSMPGTYVAYNCSITVTETVNIPK
jgi:hypothetical protein